MNTGNNGRRRTAAGRAGNAERAESRGIFLKRPGAVTGVTCGTLAAVGHVGSLNRITFSDLDDGAVGCSGAPAFGPPDSRPGSAGLCGMLAVGDAKPPCAYCRRGIRWHRG